MAVLCSKCGNIVHTVVIVWCHCGGTVVAVPLWAILWSLSLWAVRWWRSGDTEVTVGHTVGSTGRRRGAIVAIVVTVALWC